MSGVTQAGSGRLVRSRATTFTARRFDAIVGRFYSVALLLATLEVTINALQQRNLLNPVGFWLIYGSYLVSNLIVIVANWFFEARALWYLINALVILLCVVCWPIAVSNPAGLPTEYSPFVWWMTGWGGISAGLALNQYLAPIYMVVLPLAFAFVENSPYGGSSTVFVATQNAVYTVLISSVVTGVVWFLRWQARQQDVASEVAANTAAEAAAQQAISDERLRVFSVVHNEVLSALNAAVNAHSRAAKAEAATLATSAINSLSELQVEDSSTTPQQISASTLFSSIANLIRERTDRVEVSSRVEGELPIPVAVANALTEATQQAVVNSLMHGGGNTVARRVSLKASSESLKISIVDDGKGFWMNRVPKNRLGIRMVIFKRTRDVGAIAHLYSKPREGTSVVLEWSANDK